MKKNILYLSMCLVVLLIVSACDNGGKSDTAGGDKNKSITEQITQKTDSATDYMSNKFAEYKASFDKQMQDAGTSYNTKIEQLKVKMSSLNSSMKEKYSAQLEDLQNSYNDFSAKMSGLKDTSQSKWEEAKTQTKSSYNTMMQKYDKILAELKNSSN